MATRTEAIELIERRHYVLRAQWVLPVEAPKRAVLIAPATTVPGRYYHAFASWLAARGSAVLTVDLPCTGTSWARGVNANDPEALHGALRAAESVNVNDDWVSAVELAVNEVERRFGPAMPLVGVSNSVGFVLITACASRRRFERVLAVSTNHIHPEFYDNPQTRRHVYMWAMTLTDELGYFPGIRLGFGGDLPTGVGRDFADWNLAPRYHASVFAHQTATYHAPTLAVRFDDDPDGTAESVDKILHNLPLADVSRIVVDPRAMGWQACGHLGAFRRAHQDQAWARLFAPFIEEGKIAQECGHVWSSRGPTINGQPPSRVHAVDHKL